MGARAAYPQSHVTLWRALEALSDGCILVPVAGGGWGQTERGGSANQRITMADSKKRLDSNVPGNFFVDATCINCDTCRQLAPRSFEEVGEFSAVTAQPEGDERLHQAYQALLACPVGSIGTERSDHMRLKQAMASFPLLLEAACITAASILRNRSARTVISSSILTETGWSTRRVTSNT